ncbi:hypothetical protein B0J17DRAFT_645087 [Rhizoctonia solani]|nr:hypothetical protein B0J17DRAFT_645087 [Rhizoctonia solani]
MSSSPSKVSGGNNLTQPHFTPPGGGDITLRSRDGVDFLVHSTQLQLSSSVCCPLTEDATGVSYLLRFIYPNRLPLTISPDILSICLAVVQKYDVGGALEIIDELVTLDTTPHKLLSSDPIRAHRLAAQFNLVKTKVESARLITADRVDFCDLNKVPELAQKYSSLGLVYLMNIQAMRAKVLSDVLFRFDRAPVRPSNSDPDMYWNLICVPCQNGNRGTLKKTPPSWVLAWVQFVYEILLVSCEPFAKSDYLFQASILEKFKGRGDVCQPCLSDFETHSPQRPAFDRWAGFIREVLEAQLGKLEFVYAL